MADNDAAQVRMAIHGDELRDDDYFGPSLNRVARLLAIGHGGQVLVSAAGAALVVDDLPAGAMLLDRGEASPQTSRPEHIFQLGAPGLASDFPALRSGVAPTNLPAQLTSFVGREREAAEIGGLLRRHRLVTLVGVGGTGKTRLMLHVADELTDRHADGSWLIELAPLRGRPLALRSSSWDPTRPRAAIAAAADFLRGGICCCC